jgi:hypothetical protein
MLQTTPWSVATPWTSPVPYLLQQLQIVSQQLQYVQQAEHVQQIQLQQLQQSIQIVQQALSQSIGAPSSGLAAFGPSLPFAGLPVVQPFQSAGFGNSFPSIPTGINTPFGVGQPGYVM